MRRLSLLIVSVAFLAACSSGGSSDDSRSDGGKQSPAPASSPGDSGTPGATAKAPTGPPCSAVWQEGKTLPAEYAGCLDDDVLGEEEAVECADGSRLVTYANEFFARPGEKIVKPVDAPIQDTEDYSTAFSDCTGE